jgi:predicted PurR-regulated permease PerM
VALVLSLSLNPHVERLQKLKLPRSLATLLVLSLLFLIVGWIFSTIIPPFIEQTGKLLHILPQAANRLEFYNVYQQEIFSQLLAQIGSLPQNLLKITISIFSNILSIFTTLVITFYLLLQHHQLIKLLTKFIQSSSADKITKIITNSETALSYWLKGELILMISIGVLTYIGLRLLNVSIPLPLAVLAGILEIVPNIGPTISAVPAVIVALTINPLLALSTMALYILVQLFENNVLVPRVMQSAAGVNPLVSILALLIGFRLGGPVGAILGIPIALVIRVILRETSKVV